MRWAVRSLYYLLLIIFLFGGSFACAANSIEAQALYTQGNVYAEAKEFRQARSFYEKAVAADPAFALGHNALGYAQYELGHYESAEAEYNEALQLDPNMAVTYNNLGVIYIHKENPFTSTEQGGKAINYFKKAIALKPDYAKAMVNLSVAYEEKGDFWNAIQMYYKASETDGKYVQERKQGKNAQEEIKRLEEKYGTVEVK